MSDQSYNGWTNYETWNCALWIDNDQGAQEFWTDHAAECLENAADSEKRQCFVIHNAAHALAERMEREFFDAMPDAEGFYNDVLKAAVSAVDWYQLAMHYVEYAIESGRFTLASGGHQ